MHGPVFQNGLKVCQEDLNIGDNSNLCLAMLAQARAIAMSKAFGDENLEGLYQSYELIPSVFAHALEQRFLMTPSSSTNEFHASEQASRISS